MLSFDEFRAVQNRQGKSKSRDLNEKEKKNKLNKPKVVQKQEKDDPSFSDENKSSSNVKKESGIWKRVIMSIGEFIEFPQMQMFHIMIILIDTFGCYLLLSINNTNSSRTFYQDYQEDYQSIWSQKDIFRNALQSMTTFCTLFFCLESIVIFIAYGVSMLAHWGYLTDLIISGLQIYLDYKKFGKESRVLNIFRLWSVMRLFNSMLAIEKEAHNKTIEELKLSKIDEMKLNNELITIKNEVNKEKDARNAVEDMLQKYKDEVDILNEALKIAAMDIAEVAQDPNYDFEDDEDFNDESGQLMKEEKKEKTERELILDENGEEFEYNDTFPNNAIKYSNKEAIMRAIIEDGQQFSNNKVIENRPNKIQIYEDGSYESNFQNK